MTGLYVVISFIALPILSVGLVSEECLATEACTSAEDLRLEVVGVVWFAVVAVFVIAGWRGQLWGARRRSVPS